MEKIQEEGIKDKGETCIGYIYKEQGDPRSWQSS